MNVTELIVAIIGAIAGIAGAWFGYLAIKNNRRRRSTPATVQTGHPTRPYDAFLSYAPADEDHAERIARHLQTRGLRVFLAKWIDLGLVTYLEKEHALDQTRTGVLLFSTATMAHPDIRDDYAAILQRTHENDRRFIPVLIDTVDLPPYARIRRPLYLTDSRHYDANLDILTTAIRRA